MNTFHMRLESPDLELDGLRLVTVRGEEAIGRLFRFDVKAVCIDGSVEAGQLLGARVALVTELEEGSNAIREAARVWGVITFAEEQLDPRAPHREIDVTIEPRAHRLSLITMQNVFIDRTLPDVIEEKLAMVGLGDATERRLHADHAARDLIVQFDESDLAFVARHAEHLGISFFFEHLDEGDRIVFADHNGAFPSLGEVELRDAGEGLGVFAIARRVRAVPSRHVVQDYNYRTPTVELTADAPVAEGLGGGVVEYGSHHRTPERARALATLRAEGARAEQLRYVAKTSVPSMAAGRRFVLTGHAELGDLELLVVSVTHHAELPAPGREDDGPRTYENEIVAIPADRAFRPARLTPRPTMAGIYVALVQPDDDAFVGPSAKLDDQGRYRVRFLFDPKPRDGVTSHPIRMAQPHGGAGHGLHFPLRPGVEVAIAFANGDPDRPIILGALDNPATASPTTSRNARENIISTASGIVVTLKDGR